MLAATRAAVAAVVMLAPDLNPDSDGGGRPDVGGFRGDPAEQRGAGLADHLEQGQQGHFFSSHDNSVVRGKSPAHSQDSRQGWEQLDGVPAWQPASS